MERMKTGALVSDFQESRPISPSALLAFSRVFHIDHDVSKRGAKKAIVAELAGKPKVFLEACALLDFYKSVKRRYVILEYAESNGIISRASNRSSAKNDTFALLILLAQKNDRLLKEILLIDSVNLSGFVDMELRVKEPIQIEYSKFPAKLQARVKHILADFEIEMGEGKSSVYEDTLRKKQHTYLFVRRELRREMILEPERYLAARRAERIIFRFSDNGRRLKVASQAKRASTKLANAFAQRLFGQSCYYQRSRKPNELEDFRRFVKEISGSADHIPITQIVSENAPLQGNPVLSVEHEEDILPALEDLRRKGIDLLEKIENIRSLAVDYEGKRITLTVDHSDGSVELLYPDHILPELGREPFENLMVKEYGIRIRPKG